MTFNIALTEKQAGLQGISLTGDSVYYEGYYV